MTMNAECMLEILRHTDPDTVCKASRTCYSMNQLVNRYVHRLPHLTADLGVFYHPEMDTIQVQLLHRRRRRLADYMVKPEKFDFKKIKRVNRYVEVEEITLGIRGREYSKSLVKCMTRNILHMNVNKAVLLWSNKDPTRMQVTISNYSPQQIVDFLTLYETGLQPYHSIEENPAETTHGRKRLSLISLLFQPDGELEARKLKSTMMNAITFAKKLVEVEDAGKTLCSFCLAFVITDDQNFEQLVDLFPEIDPKVYNFTCHISSFFLGTTDVVFSSCRKRNYDQYQITINY